MSFLIRKCISISIKNRILRLSVSHIFQSVRVSAGLRLAINFSASNTVGKDRNVHCMWLKLVVSPRGDLVLFIFFFFLRSPCFGRVSHFHCLPHNLLLLYLCVAHSMRLTGTNNGWPNIGKGHGVHKHTDAALNKHCVGDFLLRFSLEIFVLRIVRRNRVRNNGPSASQNAPLPFRKLSRSTQQTIKNLAGNKYVKMITTKRNKFPARFSSKWKERLGNNGATIGWMWNRDDLFEWNKFSKTMMHAETHTHCTSGCNSIRMEIDKMGERSWMSGQGVVQPLSLPRKPFFRRSDTRRNGQHNLATRGFGSNDGQDLYVHAIEMSLANHDKWATETWVVRVDAFRQRNESNSTVTGDLVYSRSTELRNSTK